MNVKEFLNLNKTAENIAFRVKQKKNSFAFSFTDFLSLKELEKYYYCEIQSLDFKRYFEKVVIIFEIV